MGQLDGMAAAELQGFVEQIEQLEDQRALLAREIQDLVSAAKTAGFDTKIMRQVIRLRKMDAVERIHRDTLLDLYKQAVGIDVHESWF